MEAIPARPAWTRRGPGWVAQAGRGVRAGLRLLGAALVGGIVAGGVAGLGARLVMFAIRLLNPTFNGATTHAGSEIGRWTLEGTLALVTEGAFMGISGGLLYLLVRRWVPGTGWRKGLAFGALLLVLGGPLVIDGDFEFFRYVSPWISVGLFALLFPLYGLVISPLTERLARRVPGPPRNRLVRWTGYAVLDATVAWALWRDAVHARDILHLFG